MSDDYKPTLFTRVNGKRVLTAKHLEVRLQELSAEVSQLQEVNDVLRAKEAMQFDMLTGYEDSMSRMCSMLCELAQQQDAGRTDTDETVQVLSGVMLALRDSAQELLQQLEPSTSSDNDPSHSASHSDGSARSSNSSGSLPPMGACCGRHMQRLWSRITPQAVLDMRRVSACQLAERIRGDVMRIALARQCASNGMGGLSADALEEAVLAYGESVLLAMISADSAFLAYNLYNLETLVPETPAEDLSPHVLSQIDLSAEQKQQLVLAYQCCVSQRTSLLQQQNAISKQLQALLSGQRQPCDSDSMGPSCAASVGASAPLDSAHSCAMPSIQRSSGPAAWAEHSAQPAGSGGSGNANSSSAAFGSAFSRLHEGLLDLDGAEEADRLLKQLQRIVRLHREASRGLVYVWMDVLSAEQHADAILAAYPYVLAVAGVCQLISKDSINTADVGKQGCDTVGRSIGRARRAASKHMVLSD